MNCPCSKETLRMVQQNDPSFTTLTLVDYDLRYRPIDEPANDGEFYSDNSDDYSTLGAAIANNTHLETLEVTLSDDLPLGVTDRGFIDGLQRNSSINNLELWLGLGLGIHHLSLVGDTGQNIAIGVGQEILQEYQENNSQLTDLSIKYANLQNGGDRVIVVDTLRTCRNLQRILLYDCNITDAQLLPIVDAIRGHSILEELNLPSNDIGDAGCEALATLLIDPNCNLRILSLGNNSINDEGATAIANSLTNNNQLQKLYFYRNPVDQSDVVVDAFCNLLCSTSNMNSTYLSNHTLQTLDLGHHALNHENRQQLESLLAMNEDDNKSHIAIKKILKYHPNIDMEPMFEWGLEEDGERNLKALPYVIDWFGRAKEVVADEVDDSSSSDSSEDEDEDESYNVAERKLSAIFQFAKAMPLLLEGITRL